MRLLILGRLMAEFILMKGSRRRHGFDENFLRRHGAPAGSKIIMTPNAGMDGTTWTTVVPLLCDSIRSTTPVLKANPAMWALLVLDGFGCHAMSLSALRCFSRNKILVVKMPSHNSHHLQPLDISFFGPETKYFYRNVREFTAGHPNTNIDQWDVLLFVVLATVEVMKTPQTIINGFAKANLFPFRDGPAWLDDNASLFKLAVGAVEFDIGVVGKTTGNEMFRALCNRRMVADPYMQPSASLHVEYSLAQIGRINPDPVRAAIIQQMDFRDKASLLKKVASGGKCNAIGELHSHGCILTAPERLEKLSAALVLKKQNQALHDEKNAKEKSLVLMLFQMGIRSEIGYTSKAKKSELLQVARNLKIAVPPKTLLPELVALICE